MPAVPAVHVPVAAPILADAPLDDHVPPGVALLSVVELPWQRIVVPVIGAVVGFTVSVATEIQPPGRVYVTTQVPEESAVTRPVPRPTVAIDGQARLHVPPVVGWVSVFV